MSCKIEQKKTKNWRGDMERKQKSGEREDEAVTRMNIHMFRGPENTENTYVLLIPAADSYFLWRSQPHYNSSVPAVALKDIWRHTKKKSETLMNFRNVGV